VIDILPSANRYKTLAFGKAFRYSPIGDLLIYLLALFLRLVVGSVMGSVVLVFVFLRLVRAVGVIVIIVVILFHNYLL
jgi:hypothetical protein